MAKQNKLTRSFKDTVREMVAKDPAFKKGLMAEAMDELLSGDPAVGITIIKNYFPDEQAALLERDDKNIIWNKKKLSPTVPKVKVKGKRNVADLLIEDRENLRESFALMDVLAKSQKSMKAGKVKPFEVAIRDLKIKARKSWTVKILKGNKVTIPVALRQAHDINPGDEVEFVDRADGLIIIPTKNRPKAYGKLRKLAAKVLNDADSATLWLNESQFALDGARPVVHMKTRKGAKDVENLLIRMEYGVLL